MRKILIKNESSHSTDASHHWLDDNEWEIETRSAWSLLMLCIRIICLLTHWSLMHCLQQEYCSRLDKHVEISFS